MIKLIVGLGNIGLAYQDTRHNAGFWFVEELAKKFAINLNEDKKFHGQTGRGMIYGHDIRLLLPSTLMNRSGTAVAPMAKFYHIASDEILIIHDELDISAGNIRLKKGGGHGGHNGLRDIVPHIGADFYRLRVGIGRPLQTKTVSDWVLSKPSLEDKISIDRAILCGIEALQLLIDGEIQKATNQINGFKI